MRTRAYVYGHPLHPMLIPFPFAFLNGAFVFNGLGWYFSNPMLATTGRHLTIAGVGAGIVAAIPGVIDYLFSVPPRSSGRSRALKHALLNVSALLLFFATWTLQRGEGVSLAILSAQMLGVLALGMAGWMGGTLVYRNQMAVDHRYASAGKWRESRHHHVTGAVVAAPSDALKVDQMMLVHFDGQRIAVGRNKDRCRAVDDRCTHKGGPLSDGVLICGTVQCPWHGSQFDIATGEVKAGPATRNVATLTVMESNGQIVVG